MRWAGGSDAVVFFDGPQEVNSRVRVVQNNSVDLVIQKWFNVINEIEKPWESLKRWSLVSGGLLLESNVSNHK